MEPVPPPPRLNLTSDVPEGYADRVDCSGYPLIMVPEEGLGGDLHRTFPMALAVVNPDKVLCVRTSGDAGTVVGSSTCDILVVHGKSSVRGRDAAAFEGPGWTACAAWGSYATATLEGPCTVSRYWFSTDHRVSLVELETSELPLTESGEVDLASLKRLCAHP